MKPTYTIVEIFATPARAKVLRALAGSRIPLSVRSVARVSGISHTGAGHALRDLEAMGLVRWSRLGTALACQLEERNTYVQHMLLPAISAEESIVEELCADLIGSFSGAALSVILFGSYAYGEQCSDSDIDVFALAVDERRKQQLQDTAAREFDRYWAVYGASLSLLTYTQAEAAEHLSVSKSAFRLELENTGIILHGLGPREWGIDAREAEDKTSETE